MQRCNSALAVPIRHTDADAEGGNPSTKMGSLMTKQHGGDEPDRPPQGNYKRSTGQLIVVIENDTLVRDATVGLLRNWGYRVVAGRSRSDALTSLANRSPDLIISDYIANGTTASENIEQLRTSFHVPVLLISGETAAEPAGERHENIYQVLYKPVAPATLRTAIEQLLGS